MENQIAYAEDIKDMRAELRELNKAVPETAKGFGVLSKAVKENGPLSEREKELIALGMALVQRCEPCINFHVEGLMRAGGTREDLGDVLGLAVQMSGGPGLMYSGHALACWDELARK